MGTRKHRERQESLWYRAELAEAPGHPFYRKMDQVLRAAGFDEFCEQQCRSFYAEKAGRPSLAPGVYFRLMLIGFFEGLDSERGCAGISRHVVGDERALQERRKRLHLDPESCD